MNAATQVLRRAWRPLKRAAYTALDRVGMFSLLRRRHRDRLLVLLYHGVYEESRGNPSPLDNLHVARGEFHRQMRWLHRRYNFVSLPQVIAWLQRRAPLPPHPALVTFDDGYRNNAKVAWPILEALGIPAVFFVPTAFVGAQRLYWAEELEHRLYFAPGDSVTVGNGTPLRFSLEGLEERRAAFRLLSERLKAMPPGERERACRRLAQELPFPPGLPSSDTARMCWDEVRRLLEAGADVGSHSVTHALLPQLPASEAYEELWQSKRELEERLGIRARALAYPNGDSDPIVRALARGAGYDCAFTVQPHLNSLEDDPLALGRIPVDAQTSLVEFIANVSGMPQLWARRLRVPREAKILQIGNYPPPMCGWAIQTKFLTEEILRRGYLCQVLNINENRKKKSPDYVDVQNGFDYLAKVIRFTLAGYRLHAHVNAESPKGYALALAALGVARLALRPGILTFHGGLPQTWFPRPVSSPAHWAFRLLFRLAERISCDSLEIKHAIERYGVRPERIAAIPCFSSECLEFQPASPAPAVEAFFARRRPVFFCYVSFRPEYRLEVLRQAMARLRQRYPAAGFVWLGFPDKELRGAEGYVRTFSEAERESVLLLGNLPHDEFLTLLSRSLAFIRTPACDGVSASVLESLALGVPVVASENGRRPTGVVTYEELDPADLCRRLVYVVENHSTVRARARLQQVDNNTARMADWLLEEPAGPAVGEIAHAGTD